MLKKIFFTILIGFLLFLPSVAVLAESYGLGDTGKELGYTSGSRNVYQVVNLVVQVGLSMLAFVFFGLMLYAGFRWMTAQGKEEHVTKAKETLIAAVVGLVIVIASYAISNFVLGAIGGQ